MKGVCLRAFHLTAIGSEPMSALMPTYKRLPVAFERGEGAWLFDSDGKRYLDGLCGIAVTNLGHCHPAVSEAIATQANTLVHTSNLYRIPAQEQLAATLSDATGMERLFFCNSGAEANEAAIKLARRYGHDRGIKTPTIIVLDGAFHGRTMGALAATAGHIMKADFEPMLSGFVRVPRDDLAAIEEIAASNTDVVAVLVEPVQGEGGVRPLDPTYLANLRTVCDKQGWLLMFDEVQTGNGRCGSIYAFQRLGVTPDVLTTAKGLGNGFPIGCCMARGAAADVLSAGDHGTTYGGNPLGCTAAQAVMDTLADGTLCQRADTIRSIILDHFQRQLADTQCVKEVRGLGLMIGIAVNTPTDTLVRTALDHGALINVTAGDTIRLLPPLIMNDDEAAQLGTIVADVLNATRETQS